MILATMTSLPEVRRKDKLMADADARALLAAGRTGRLATTGPDAWPYVIPLLYVVLDGEIWTHNTRANGHLRRNVDHDARVCFEVDEAGEVFPYGRYECDTSVAYRSVIAFGRIRVVEDRDNKARFCDALMAKYGNPAWGRPESVYPRLDQITVYAITVERLTGKETPLPALDQQWPASDQTKAPHTRAN